MEQALRNGSFYDPDPVAALYQEHRSWLHRWLKQKLDCDEQAYDVIQNIFVRVLLKRDELSQLREPRAYLTTIAHGLVNDFWRRQKLERAYLEALAALPELTYPCEEQRAEIIETLLQIDLMLDTLPSPVRQAFLLSQLDGLTYKQIGLRLAVSERTIKNYMSQAMLRCLRIINLSADT